MENNNASSDSIVPIEELISIDESNVSKRNISKADKQNGNIFWMFLAIRKLVSSKDQNTWSINLTSFLL